MPKIVTEKKTDRVVFTCSPAWKARWLAMCKAIQEPDFSAYARQTCESELADFEARI